MATGLLFRSMGSVEADLVVLVVINSNTTKKDEALSHLVEGLDSRILEGLNISAIRVLGKQGVRRSTVCHGSFLALSQGVISFLMYTVSTLLDAKNWEEKILGALQYYLTIKPMRRSNQSIIGVANQNAGFALVH